PLTPLCLRSPHLPISLLSHSPAPPSARLYSLSLRDARPISPVVAPEVGWAPLPATPAIALPLPGQLSVRGQFAFAGRYAERQRLDRKSTRLNSSHVSISYAVFCLKKKKIKKHKQHHRPTAER